MGARTLYDKLWEDHLVKEREDGTALIYIDRHLLHEVTSPQAFEGLRLANRKPWRIDANLATPDHNVPTTGQARGVEGIEDPISRIQVQALDANCADFGILEFPMNDVRQGIVHVISPEQGTTLPGMTIVCGDSHTATHGAFGALAHGIGTSEVEHVLATQCLIQQKMKNMLIKVEGELPKGVSAKDIILAIIAKIGTAGGNGHAIEFAGSAIRSLSMEGRMTVCNMAIEAGARAGMIAVDDTTIEYIQGRPFAPDGELWDEAVSNWKQLLLLVWRMKLLSKIIHFFCLRNRIRRFIDRVNLTCHIGRPSSFSNGVGSATSNILSTNYPQGAFILRMDLSK